jgi:hypothetical protein
MIGDKPVRARYHRVWDRYVRELSGGLTILKPAKGTWVKSPTEVVEERMIPVRIACSPEVMDKIIDFTIKYYKQDAIMAYQISNNVIIRNKKV